MHEIVIIDAPSNLGLRPPAPGTVPGCYKLAGALRDRGILDRLGAREGGVVVPPRYDLGDWRPGDGVFNAAAVAAYTPRLADRIEPHLRAGRFPLVLGGDCSIQLGASLAMRRIGRYGLVAVDASADFRHTGNTPATGIGASGGEEVAIATGRGQDALSDLEGLKPYLRDEDVRFIGIRDGDEDLVEFAALRIPALTVGELRRLGPADAAAAVALSPGTEATRGFWLHLDADVLDPAVMPAVDSPDPDGLLPGELAGVLGALLSSPHCVGMNVTIYDPDRDPGGSAGDLLTDLVVDAFGAARGQG
ncbi:MULTISPECIES: arginase family protein [Streptomyces]|uniref:Arginase family protein n=1 Tax=Streptomyces tsukubensis (strain DSM 42081 / NBRC 108919 / NRRL 18488 / 9993) TaxID=1114943 RepID=I2N978_STRT9|nr:MULTISPECIES: arginase family protein [Streptomyces]AZK97429.1 arginase [Streptomyces tsukubensis]EIF93575.1 Arginase/agmatinase/formiminoglutamase [Streptomyces tsukubensis NRRL18488]MYS63510.1 arginase family protein [Streptomyces sp. SID5473]QKM66617.1 arginase family protein [Streptomyces tsukubensis NRRL18488]TAI45038.1 arginase family protein [Streptomyces tsukubensis]